MKPEISPEKKWSTTTDTSNQLILSFKEAKFIVVEEVTNILQISEKLAKDVFLVPILTTCGGLIVNFFFSPATISGFFSLMMLNTRVSNSS